MIAAPKAKGNAGIAHRRPVLQTSVTRRTVAERGPQVKSVDSGYILRLARAPTLGPRLYEDAPRLPDAGPIDVRSLTVGQWVEVEIGPGRGWFLVERVETEPLAGMVGLEIRRKWAAIVDARLSARGLRSRARVFAEDARYALPRLGPDAAVDRVFVNFPDPWWKARHRKRWLMQQPLLDEIARLLRPGGELFVQTDVEDRAAAHERLIQDDARFWPAGDDGESARLAENPYGARSPRERRAMAEGLPVYRSRWRRR